MVHITENSTKEEVREWFQTYEDGYFGQFADLFKDKPVRVLLGYTKDDLREFCGNAMKGSELYNALHPQPVLVNQRKRLWDLLVQGIIDPEPHIVDRVIETFSSQILFADTPEQVKRFYELARTYPGTSTKNHILASHGLVTNGPWNKDFTGSTILTGHRKGAPCLIKILPNDGKEANVIRELGLSSVGGAPLVESELVQIKPPGQDECWCAVMDQFPITVWFLSYPIPISSLVKGGERMRQALEWFHQRDYIHMDIKPSNIMVDRVGDWFLGDFGSCVKKGTHVTSSTAAFQFLDMNNRLALPQFDFFALAVTLTREVNRTGFASVIASGQVDLEKFRSLVQQIEDNTLREMVDDLLKEGTRDLI